jgi:hypothetical protein
VAANDWRDDVSERRYSEEEVARIFERATEAQSVSLRPSSRSEGLTLGELQEIGREVGIAPELVAGAARSIESTGVRSPRRGLLGLPIRVGHTVQLPRRLTETEWQQLVVELRDTFDARGKLKDEGAFKQWTNGHLEALLEPTRSGHQLRLRTYKEGAAALMLGGGITLTIAVAALVAALIRGDLADRLPGFVTLFTIGLGLLGTSVVQIPGWARLRQSQMEAIAERAALMASSDPEEEPPTP